ncbi:inhibitor of apoptosis 2 [Spodoptera frugiperda multiple nucleopolyhedrovirus]|uniref:IAP-2 n=1 Tax=Spodoptera frugiperda nuclear polyhedrosis virus TaxID=10455 RepID=A1YJ77_NPVSF|nr:inhibitor of apoptosis 2 [Spodoptera frugiperda multiple nucleopolyhedrovirus]ABM45797.1 inhibitor of apoptosis 2 [Spodoptera frugiperda multiple nucleopolyhedrovirus]ADV91320.1 iap-2 [Spodoptera frugiperda multiple nucleopolyhedrovirus]AFH59030.1 iap-2 [Spodoptera frugiperda multiple nucleopolyhedrovirus]AIW01498.1 inhibitor of apoptosis 2 protein [Spodoptera frugiperda multiple nucleopolyhedrovirus]QED40000.1 IAP-2 [Spodoptera frugiperda multiple nucleopolyhedrovirus]
MRIRNILPKDKDGLSSNCYLFLKMTSPNWNTYDLAPPGFYQNIVDRLETFENSYLTREYINDLVASGIYRDAMCNYKCAFCPLYLKKLDEHSLKYHKFSTCPMATKRLFENETLRKQSFCKFKTARHYYKDMYELLAKNGFYYYGKKFEIICSSCKFVIVKLNKNDNVALIHGRYSPDCVFNAPSAPHYDEIDELANQTTIVSRIYPDLSNEISMSINSDDQTLSSSSTAVDTQKDDVMCKICFERERDTCFLPCRHVSTCSQCAKRCKVCCICRKTIENKLEVFLQ